MTFCFKLFRYCHSDSSSAPGQGLLAVFWYALLSGVITTLVLVEWERDLQDGAVCTGVGRILGQSFCKRALVFVDAAWCSCRSATGEVMRGKRIL